VKVDTGKCCQPDNYDRLGPAHPDELVDGPDTPPGQLRQQDHALHKNGTYQYGTYT